MKKTLQAVVSVLTGIVMFSMPMTALAENKWLWYSDWCDSFRDDPFTVITDTFQYSTSIYGMTLENDLVDTEYLFMVSGIIRDEDGSINRVAITQINEKYGARHLSHFEYEDLENYHGETIQVGDLLNYHNDWIATEGIPSFLSPTGQIEYLGNGVDIFGEEFYQVIQHEGICADDSFDAIPTAETAGDDSSLHIKPVQPELMKGDASGDDEINVLDVIEINRAVLGKTTLTEEQTQAADVDGNGIIDAADSLLILKYLVGIVESL